MSICKLISDSDEGRYVAPMSVTEGNWHWW